MNPTLCDLLSVIAPHITWAAGYDPRVEASTHLIINDIVLALSVRTAPRFAWVTAVVSSHDGPEIRVASRNRPDLRAAWTEVAEVVARVDAAAGAAMSNPRESKADAKEQT